MLKKIIYFTLVLVGLLIASYFLQPIKKGSGLDTTTKYELVKNWLDLPKELILGNPTGIGIDTNQNIVVFHRAVPTGETRRSHKAAKDRTLSCSKCCMELYTVMH